MKKLFEVCLFTAFIAYLMVGVDLFPFETHFNPLDWDVRKTVKFVIFFLIVYILNGGVESLQNSNKKEK